MIKRKKIVVLCLCTLVFLWIFIPVITGIWTNTASDGKVKVFFFFTPAGAKLVNFHWKILEKPILSLKISGSLKIPWKSILFGSQQLLAFQTPASINLPQGKSKVNFSGEIQGNFKTGTINIKNGNIWLEKFGKIFVAGKLVQWGKETCEIEGNVKDFAIDEFRTMLGIQNLPFAGTMTGKLSITINKDIVKMLIFDVDFNKLLLQESSHPLSGHAKGTYDFLQKKCLIETGNIFTESGGKISLKGFISPEDFSVKIESEGVNLEEIVSQLPEKWREKFKFTSDSKISINGEGKWKRADKVPFFAGIFSIPGKIQYKNFSCSSLLIEGSQEKEKITVSASNIDIGKINCDRIMGTIIKENGKYRGDFTFKFYEGLGDMVFVTNQDTSPRVYARAQVQKINLEKFIHSLNTDILITGLVNVICFLEFGNKDFSVQARIDNVPGMLFSQKLNISAVKALASLGSSSFAGSIGKQFGSNNFYYRKLSGVISLTNGQLTIEGTAKRAGNHDYLITSEIFGSGINVLVDRKNNSIHVEDLKRRILNAMQQNKAQFKFS
ncbi:MAG: hypothetical protein ACP5JO_01380 [Candidatus Ratteibacteria bacterium]